MHGFTRRFQFCRQSGNIGIIDQQHHADSAIEGAGHFLRLDIALPLQKSHQARLFPGAGIDHGMCAIGQNAWDIFQQSAARDVGKGSDFATADSRQQALHINSRGFDQVIDQQSFCIEQGRTIQFPPFVGRQSADQRITIGMHTGTGEAEQHLIVGNLVTGQLFPALNRANTETRKVIIACRIHARHFRGFAANQCATGHLAAFGDARDNPFGNSVFQLARGKIIEKKQRLCALHDQIVDAHGNQIDSHGVMPVEINRQFQLGPDPVIRGNQQRIVIACRFRIEKSAKAAQFRCRARPRCCFHQRSDRLDQGVAGVDGYASLGVSVAFRRCVFVRHGPALRIRAWISTSVWAKGAKFSPMTLSVSLPATVRQGLSRPTLRTGLIALAVLMLAVAAVHALWAQVEGNRGIAAVVSSTDIDVGGIAVDVRGDNAENAQQNGWALAQRLAWKKLGGPELSDSQIDSMVSAVVIEQEQIGPRRYIATLSVIFDRARAGRMLGTGGNTPRSAPMLLIPVTFESGTTRVYEMVNPWQRAWAEYQAGASAIDYVRPSGMNGDSLLVTYGQIGRRSRTWWRNILDQFDAADVLVPIARLERQWPGGPVKGTFSARYGPDDEYLDGFVLTAKNESELPKMLSDAVLRMDAIFTAALASGKLKPDPTLNLGTPALDPALQRLIDLGRAADANDNAEREAADAAAAAGIPVATPNPAAGSVVVATFVVQFSSPDGGTVDATLAAVRGTSGVRGAATSSLAIGGTSVMRVSYGGTLEQLAAALRSRGFTVTQGSNALAISR